MNFHFFAVLATFSTIAFADPSSADGTIKNLAGEPDYKQVRLHWDADSNLGDDYQIRYCELQTWGAQRCRTQAAILPEINDLEDSSKSYTAEVKGLRMATTYSFEIKPSLSNGREDRSEGDDKNQNIIVIPTKGFSAKATQCLPHASEIEVSTGPYFGGRIAVEATDGERCALDGEPDSPRDTYTLRINHTECGSQVNETTVATFVLVQENLPILTHSTRRFLVLCSYQPETLTVRAGINLPTTGNSGRGQASIGPHYEDNYLGRREGRSYRGGRLLQKSERFVQDDFHATGEDSTGSNNIVPIVIIAMLALTGLIGIVAIFLKISNKKILKDPDSISIASTDSSTSELQASKRTHII